jgi:hypothetical protein
MSGYYGYPMIKPPEWTDLIPTYFFTGGMAGTAATLAFAERCAKNDELARTMLLGAVAGSAVSGFCLIADLKRPERFLNMLRVFKPTSPMSVGVYIFSAFSGATFVAAACEFTGVLRPIGRVFEAIAALLGPAMSCYTAVLIGDTVVPAWHYGRRTMPAVFAATSASTAAGWGLLFGNGNAGTARRLAAVAGPAVLIALQRLHQELGPRQKHAYETGEAARFANAAKILSAAGTATAVLSKYYAPLSKVAGALLLAGGVAERFAVFRAGCNSARDPSYTIEAQRNGSASRSETSAQTA